MGKTPRNPELEAAIVAAPESFDAFLVYADWLLEQGEPLGELVSVQAALLKAVHDGDDETAASLRDREAALTAENEKEWLGHFAGYEHRWRFGFLESIRITEPGRDDCIDLLGLLASRFLRELEIELLGHRLFENVEVVSAIVEAGLPPLLRKLTLAPAGDCRAVDVGSIRALWSRLGQVEDFTIRAGNMLFGEIVLPRATRVHFGTTVNEDAVSVASAIANASWPNLVDLKIELTDQFYAYRASRLDPAVFFEPLMTSLSERAEAGHAPVRRLALVGHLEGDALAQIIAASPALRTLEELDLSAAAMREAGARAILREASRFQHLKRLDLSKNQLAEGEVAGLRAAFAERVNVENQLSVAPYVDENYYEEEGGYGDGGGPDES